MIDLLAGSSVAIALVYFVTPRFFFLVDVLEMQRRLHSTDLITEDMKPSHTLPKQLRTNISPVLDFAALSESLARATRSGASPHDALLASLQRHQFHHPCWSALFDDVATLQSCDSSLATARESVEPRSNDAQCLSLLESAMVHGNFVPSALDHASSVLRDRAACGADTPLWCIHMAQ